MGKPLSAIIAKPTLTPLVFHKHLLWRLWSSCINLHPALANAGIDLESSNGRKERLQM
jgi:hypothetical protein